VLNIILCYLYVIYDLACSLLLVAIVVGMTYGACQGPSNMPAGVLGVSTALAQEDRLHPKDRLRQQPAGDSTEESQSRAMKTKAPQRLFHQKRAGDSTEESQSRAMKTKAPQRLFHQKRAGPARTTEAKDGSDERHDRTQPISDQGPFPTIGSEAKGRAYASQMPIQGERCFIKRDCQSSARG
jgi:hypothetical protein